MEWWIWIISGMALLAFELFAPLGFFLFLIGTACLITGAFVYLGVLPSVTHQFVVGGLIGIVLLLTVRRPLSKILGALGKGTGSDIQAQRVRINEMISPHSSGRGELGGSSWTVRNETAEILHKDCVYSVDKVEGLTLVVTNSKKL